MLKIPNDIEIDSCKNDKVIIEKMVKSRYKQKRDGELCRQILKLDNDR